MRRENRDKKAKELKEHGYKIRRTSIRNQLLHPMYLQDYPVKLPDEDKGFGNTIYKTHFSTIYIIEIKDYPN
jgi:hypothetical protein